MSHRSRFIPRTREAIYYYFFLIYWSLDNYQCQIVEPNNSRAFGKPKGANNRQT